MKKMWFMLLCLLAFNLNTVFAEDAVVSDGKTVKIDYTLTVNGEVVDSSEGRGPLEYVQGQHMIIPGLEKKLEGMKVNEEKVVNVSSDEAYGPVDPRAFVEIPKSDLPKEMAPEKGLKLQIQNAAGQPIVGVIEDVKQDTVVVNFNHPLAGEDLQFKVKIVEIK